VTTLVFVLPTLVLMLIQAGLLTCIFRTLIHKYFGNEQKPAEKLEIGTMDILPLLLSTLFIISLAMSYIAILSLLKLWAVILVVALLTIATLILCQKLWKVLKKLK